MRGQSLVLSILYLSLNKNVKWTFMVSTYNLKSYLSNSSWIFQIEAMEAVLWLIKRVYFFLLTQ